MTQLQNLVLQSPGTLGLNTQDEDKAQDYRYAVEANNCIISKNGLLESRKGFKGTNGTAATGTPTLDVVYSYVTDAGVEHIISAGGNDIFSGTTSLTSEKGGLTITADNWQFQTYKGEVFGYQSGHAPIFWDGVAGTFALLSSKGTSAGLVNSSWHLAAFGRSWVGDTTSLTQINYSDLLVPEAFTGGSSGTLDLDTVFPYSNDTIVTCAALQNRLIIFCQRSIIIYKGADDPSTMTLEDVIPNIGCVARDSVQNIGNDIFFLANDGVRSLGRTILQDNMPLSEISKEIRDDLIETIDASTLSTVRSTYNEKQGFYVINFPGQKQYVCDVRLASQNIYRWTTWDAGVYGLTTSYSTDNDFYAGLAGGFLSKYNEYYDTDTSDGSVDQTYVMRYRSAWVDTGYGSMKAVWKKATWYIASLIDIQAVITWAFDFEEDVNTVTKNISGGQSNVYGTATYGTAVYGTAFRKQVLNVPMSKTGSIIRLGFQAVVGNGKFAFNKVDLFNKVGKLR